MGKIHLHMIQQLQLLLIMGYVFLPEVQVQHPAFSSKSHFYLKTKILRSVEKLEKLEMLVIKFSVRKNLENLEKSGSWNFFKLSFFLLRHYWLIPEIICMLCQRLLGKREKSQVIF